MSFESLSEIIKRPDEQYYLQHKEEYTEEIEPQKILKDEVGNIIVKNEVGNIREKWQDIIELIGVIQHRQTEKISEAGQESKIRYYGYFTPTFHILNNKLANFRVKIVRPHETLYLKIIEYDPNNYLRDQQHHIVLVMEEDRKYFGRQE